MPSVSISVPACIDRNNERSGRQPSTKPSVKPSGIPMFTRAQMGTITSNMKCVVVLKVPIPYTASWVLRETMSGSFLVTGLLISIITCYDIKYLLLYDIGERLTE